MNVLVLGGTGFVGRSLCQRLAREAGGAGRITVVTRDAAAAQHLRGLPGLEVVQADIFDPAQLAALVARHDAVVNLVAILHGSEAEFRRVHVELIGSLVQACRAAGRPRIVHVSALGVGSEAPSRYLRSKSAGEDELKVSGLEADILRPSVIFGEHDRFLNLFARLLRVAPVFPLAGAHALFQPVWVEDVAAGILACLRAPPPAGLRFCECVGPKVYELIELVRLTGRWSGHRRPVLALPEAIGRLQAAVLERMPGGPMMSRDNLDSMRAPNVATGRLPTLQQLGVTPSALEAVAPGYLARPSA
jgi:NADH dehydrogenase